MATATYPPPPPYYKLYKDYIQNPNSAPEPPPPIQGTYVLYGANYTTDDVLPTLEEQGVRQLYPKGPNVDFKKELRSLNRELQLHLLELADVLVERPSQYARRVEDISLIFKNLYHLLNSMRPHQARATLIHILELQIQRRKQAVEDIKRRREEAQRLLQEAIGTLDGFTFMDAFARCGGGLVDALNTNIYGNGNQIIVLSRGYGTDQCVLH
ncbi:unnamed protein product [Fraxinus pennsylvanica]|uniref:Mediator of RNA polymerase II transcription subunit 7 n=1 Tax=Fraxinus pennsylvanica TaxID=56036 RepID=A0AAD2E973_9LAMI|nr:unnamed protein product [Fraxinus pennsylvanica]